MTSSAQKTTSLEDFRLRLHRHNLKATPQRLAVHKAMMKLGHASADMVCEEIAACGDTPVTVASVYNILSHLALLGIYDHRLSRNSKMYFDVNTHDHMHLYDTVNHHFKDLIDDELMDLLHARLGRRRFKGYKIEGIDIQILCRPTKRNTNPQL